MAVDWIIPPQDPHVEAQIPYVPGLGGRALE